MSREFLERTREFWVNWVRGLAVSYEWQPDVIRAAISLKLCTFEETGAITAALTTSIPEAPNTPRTWDYRFCWLRDAYFVIRALNRLGATQSMENYLDYITTIVADADSPLKPGLRDRPQRHRRRAYRARAAGLSRHGACSRRKSGRRNNCSTTPTAASSSALRKCSSTSGCRAWEMSVSFAISSTWVSRRGVSISSRTPAFGNIADASAIHTHSATMCWVACDRLARIAVLLGLTIAPLTGPNPPSGYAPRS